MPPVKKTTKQKPQPVKHGRWGFYVSREEPGKVDFRRPSGKQ